MQHLDLNLLSKHVADGVVHRRAHPTLPLAIYNYSPRCQYDRLWDDVSRRARGLIMNGERIVARPLPKFFNDTEHPDGEIPWHLPSEVTEKLDGSLLIVFHFDGAWHFATRGAFASPQAEEGRRIFTAKYAGVSLDPTVTYLFEVIYGANKIVVDYGGREDCILLAMVETDSGRERELNDAPAGLNVVRRLPPDADARELRKLICENEEGYVVRFADGFRVKVKGERYVQLHRLITGVSSRTIWEYLSQGKPFEEMLAITPDEFNEWVRREAANQQASFDSLILRAEEAHATVQGLPSRKDQALLIMAEYRDVSALAFAMLDGKPTAPIAWKNLYPDFRRPSIAERLEN